MREPTLQITEVKISDLNPAAYNPRKWPPSAIKNLSQSIKRFGIVDPILANSAPERKNIVIGGHFRLKIAKELGYEKVPVVYLNIPDEQKEKELNLRLNRNSGEWDIDLLKEMDLNLLLDVGFSDEDLSQMWDDVIEIEDDNFNQEKELDKVGEVTIQEGDTYQLGEHRLICGDSTDQKVVENLLEDELVDMVYCDPPYNISLSYSDGVGTKGKYGGSKFNDSKTNAQYEEFIGKTLINAKSVSKENCHFFYWCDERYIGLFQNLYENTGIKNQRVCLWIKNSQNATPQVAFNKSYEPCVYGIQGKPFLSNNPKFSEILNTEVDNGNRCLDDILDLFNIWLEKRLPTNEYQHPTEKPPKLHERPLRRCTKPHDLVLDLFGGSGSTLIACEQLKRRCYLVEIDPLFCHLIITRYEQLTGRKAKKIN